MAPSIPTAYASAKYYIEQTTPTSTAGFAWKSPNSPLMTASKAYLSLLGVPSGPLKILDKLANHLCDEPDWTAHHQQFIPIEITVSPNDRIQRQVKVVFILLSPTARSNSA